MNYEIIDQICKKESEKLCSGEIIIGFFVLIAMAVIFSVQPAKENLKPHPVYEKVITK